MHLTSERLKTCTCWYYWLHATNKNQCKLILMFLKENIWWNSPDVLPTALLIYQMPIKSVVVNKSWESNLFALMSLWICDSLLHFTKTINIKLSSMQMNSDYIKHIYCINLYIISICGSQRFLGAMMKSTATAVSLDDSRQGIYTCDLCECVFLSAC